MRRCIDIAASLVTSPEVLFLDEPTSGLDPRSRNQVWDLVRQIASEGTTVLLTTQYLEEADRLADLPASSRRSLAVPPLRFAPIPLAWSREDSHLQVTPSCWAHMARNEVGEVHYHAHVLIGKFAKDAARGRVFSLNSASGGNSGKARLGALKAAWKEGLDAQLKERLGLVVTQGAPYARPALTLGDGSYVPALNRESRRMLDKHLSSRVSGTSPSGAVTSANFRWTHFDAAIFELASSRRAGGWSPEAFCDLFPKLAPRLKTYQSRVATLKRIGYLTPEGQVTYAFTLHYRARAGDHPELQRLRADLFKAVRAGRNGQRGGGGKGAGGQPAEQPPPTEVRPDPALEGSAANDPDVDLWLALHRHRRIGRRLSGSASRPRSSSASTSRHGSARPTPELLQQLRIEAQAQARLVPAEHSLPTTKGIIRSYCAMHQGRVTSIFVLSKGLLTLRYAEHKTIAGPDADARTHRLLLREGEETGPGRPA